MCLYPLWLVPLNTLLEMSYIYQALLWCLDENQHSLSPPPSSTTGVFRKRDPEKMDSFFPYNTSIVMIFYIIIIELII